jgi:hypothetical protein
MTSARTEAASTRLWLATMLTPAQSVHALMAIARSLRSTVMTTICALLISA